MKLGYNTNGLAFHRWQDALELLAESGYASVAITVDCHCLDPFGSGFVDELAQMRRTLERLRLASVVETGARYLLDPRHKHEPTLLSPEADGRRRRIEFLKTCIDIAAELGSEAVSFWSGAMQRRREQPDEESIFRSLAAGIQPVIEHAAARDVRLGFEPEPGMFIESMADYDRLLDVLARPEPERFGLTIDVGHLHCVEDEPIPVHLSRWQDRLFNIHIEDMRRGVHEHLPFGEGEIDFVPVLAALEEIGYAGGTHVELSRHG
ncbi:MAG: sugar phosphate isomerase/epimerase, partial [Planctomycetes bacterium]|nr:sugar phosphate isomerase/epimerase [Planctomycetota bacterium]